jgi:preprotein translocase subunit YajC
MKTKLMTNILTLIWAILLFVVLFLSVRCNPVKQVLRDQDKLEQVARVVVKGGWCANDTTYITKSDTLVEIDTFVNVKMQIDTQKVNEFVYITNWKTRDIIKSITIHDTLRSYIVDNARVRLLQTDSARLSNEVITWEGKAKRRQLWIFALIGLWLLIRYLRDRI